MSGSLPRFVQPFSPMTTKLHQITEDDLAVLERELPELMSVSLMQCNDHLTRKKWEAVRDVLSRVRWDYGPPSSVTEIDAGEDGEAWKVG